MNGFFDWLRRLGFKCRDGLIRFMSGRYGTDKLNMAILLLGVVVSLISVFLRVPVANLILTLISYLLMGVAIFRCLSRDQYRRYQENQRFLQFFPRCRQPVRVPRGKGKIAITCPKCRERFIRKT